MSQNKLPETLPMMQTIIGRIYTAEKSQQKEIRITIQEARELSLELAMLTSKMNANIQEIKEAIKTISDNTQKVDIRLDGGGFN